MKTEKNSFVWATQGKTEHFALLLEPLVEGKDHVLIRWCSTQTKELVPVSSIRLDDNLGDHHGGGGGGGRESRRRLRKRGPPINYKEDECPEPKKTKCIAPADEGGKDRMDNESMETEQKAFHKQQHQKYGEDSSLMPAIERRVINSNNPSNTTQPSHQQNESASTLHAVHQIECLSPTTTKRPEGFEHEAPAESKSSATIACGIVPLQPSATWHQKTTQSKQENFCGNDVRTQTLSNSQDTTQFRRMAETSTMTNVQKQKSTEGRLASTAQNEKTAAPAAALVGPSLNKEKMKRLSLAAPRKMPSLHIKTGVATTTTAIVSNNKTKRTPNLRLPPRKVPKLLHRVPVTSSREVEGDTVTTSNIDSSVKKSTHRLSQAQPFQSGVTVAATNQQSIEKISAKQKFQPQFTPSFSKTTINNLSNNNTLTDRSPGEGSKIGGENAVVVDGKESNQTKALTLNPTGSNLVQPPKNSTNLTVTAETEKTNRPTSLPLKARIKTKVSLDPSAPEMSSDDSYSRDESRKHISKGKNLSINKRNIRGFELGFGIMGKGEVEQKSIFQSDGVEVITMSPADKSCLNRRNWGRLFIDLKGEESVNRNNWKRIDNLKKKESCARVVLP